jgi:putative membrane protein (TIGR04086 family)
MVFQFLYILTYLPEVGGGASEELIDKAVKEMTTSPDGLLNLAIIGALCTALGGYIGGRMARSEKIKHGALVGLASLIAGMLITAMFGEGNPVPDWYQALIYILPIPVGALGGYFAEKRW